MGFLDAVRAFIDPSSVKPQPAAPFDQFRYPALFVYIPPGKRAPRYCVISAAQGVDEFLKIFPYASEHEIASVQCAFEFSAAPAIRVIPVY